MYFSSSLVEIKSYLKENEIILFIAHKTVYSISVNSAYSISSGIEPGQPDVHKISVSSMIDPRQVLSIQFQGC